QEMFTLLAFLGIMEGTADTGGSGEEKWESMTSDEREKGIIQAEAVHDQLLGELTQKRAFRREIGEETSFCRLPTEILSMIISLLPFRDRMFSRVSHRLREIERKAPQLKPLEETEYLLTVQMGASDQVTIRTCIVMDEEDDNICKFATIPFESAISILNTKFRTVKPVGVSLVNIGRLRNEQWETLCKLIPFITVKEFISIHTFGNAEAMVAQKSFSVQRLIEVLKRNNNIHKFDLTSATITVTAEQLMEIRRMHSSMPNLREFEILIESHRIDDIVKSIFGLDVSSTGWITREMVKGLQTSKDDADILVYRDGPHPTLFRREMKKPGKKGRMVTEMVRVENNPLTMRFKYIINNNILATDYHIQIPRSPSLPF
ncbi:hypothetical protein PFISCL1PPCAC_24140, partial [Pristionchus fissidentatus]